MEFTRLARLFMYILRNGKFRYSGPDINARKIEIADGLKGHAIIPGKKYVKRGHAKHDVLRAFVAEAAYLKNSLKSEAGHLSLPEARICYIRIPKSASTALCRTILLTRFAGLQARDTTPEEINILSDLHLDKSVTERNDMTFFTVVRNPFARIVSVYREFFESGHKPFLYENYLFGIFKQGFSFQEFVEVVRRIPDRLKDQHLKPQSMFLEYYERRNIPVMIMDLENPEQIDQFLGERGLRFEAFNESNVRYDYRAYYDRQTLSDVSALYKQDVERFGYDRIRADLEFMIEQKDVRI